MAFAVSGATMFSILSSLEVDQRLVLAGYRPVELLLGRLLFLGPLGLVIAAAFTALMAPLSHPTRPWLLALVVGLVALQSVPFGLAVGAGLGKELEGTLVLIGVIGMQLAVEVTSPVARFLPFYGPSRLIASSLTTDGPILSPVIQTATYGLALMILADEPTGSLDHDSSDLVLDLFAELRTAGATILAVSHDARLDRRADRLVQLVDGASVEAG